MLHEFRYRRTLRRLQKEYSRAVARVTEELRSNGMKDNLDGLADELKLKVKYEQKIDSLVTEHLLEKAHRYLIPLPEISDHLMWSGLDKTPAYAHLTREGTSQLLAQIREHEKYERERMGFWVTSIVGLLGAIIGVVGILIAYAALLKSP